MCFPWFMQTCGKSFLDSLLWKAHECLMTFYSSFLPVLLNRWTADVISVYGKLDSWIHLTSKPLKPPCTSGILVKPSITTKRKFSIKVVFVPIGCYLIGKPIIKSEDILKFLYRENYLANKIWPLLFQLKKSAMHYNSESRLSGVYTMKPPGASQT